MDYFSMNYEETQDMIKRHEGFSDKIYLDTEGVPTGGWGHAFLVGSHVPLDVSIRLFDSDFRAAMEDYDRLELDLDTVRQAVIMDMLFNLGLPRLMGFKKMLSALRDGDYDRAADEMKDSKWYRQVKGRAVELERMMRMGEGYI